MLCQTSGKQYDAYRTKRKIRIKKNQRLPIKWIVDRKYKRSTLQIYFTLLSIEYVQKELQTPYLSQIISEYASSRIKKCKRYNKCKRQFYVESDDEGNIIYDGFHPLTKKRDIVCNECEKHYSCQVCKKLDSKISDCDECDIKICRQCIKNGYIDEENYYYSSSGTDDDRFPVNLCEICKEFHCGFVSCVQ